MYNYYSILFNSIFNHFNYKKDKEIFATPFEISKINYILYYFNKSDFIDLDEKNTNILVNRINDPLMINLHRKLNEN